MKKTLSTRPEAELTEALPCRKRTGWAISEKRLDPLRECTRELGRHLREAQKLLGISLEGSVG